LQRCGEKNAKNGRAGMRHGHAKCVKFFSRMVFPAKGLQEKAEK
jgi:hypothetical protein